jgi:hypothetical protein
MRGPHYERILASMVLSLMLAAPLGAFAQDSEERAAELFLDQTELMGYVNTTLKIVNALPA